MGNYSGHRRASCSPVMPLGSTKQIPPVSLALARRNGVSARGCADGQVFYGNSRVTNFARWVPVLVMVCE